MMKAYSQTSVTVKFQVQTPLEDEEIESRDENLVNLIKCTFHVSF